MDKFIRVFPEQQNSNVEFYVNPLKISSAMIAYLKDTGKYQLWVNVDGDSYPVGTFDSKFAAIERLTEIIKE